jgi:hypothetical protein
VLLAGLARAPVDYLVPHNVACAHAALASSDPARKRLHEHAAIDVLAAAVRAWRGGLAGPDELQLIEAEDVFKPLRDRPEFRTLPDREKPADSEP